MDPGETMTPSSSRGELEGAKAHRRATSMTFVVLGLALEFFTRVAPELRFAGHLKAKAYCLRSGGLVP
jgi:hypothetical protein